MRDAKERHLSYLGGSNRSCNWKGCPEKSIQTRIDEARRYREAAEKRWDDAGRLVKEARTDWAKWAMKAGDLEKEREGKIIEPTTGIPKSYQACCAKMGWMAAQGLLDLDTRKALMLVKGLGAFETRVETPPFGWCPFCGAKLPAEKKKVEWLSDLPGAIG